MTRPDLGAMWAEVFEADVDRVRKDRRHHLIAAIRCRHEGRVLAYVLRHSAGSWVAYRSGESNSTWTSEWLDGLSDSVLAHCQCGRVVPVDLAPYRTVR